MLSPAQHDQSCVLSALPMRASESFMIHSSLSPTGLAETGSAARHPPVSARAPLPFRPGPAGGGGRAIVRCPEFRLRPPAMGA